jgi:hypothetical protein
MFSGSPRVGITSIVGVTAVGELLQDPTGSYRISTESYRSYELLQIPTNPTEFLE